MNRAVSWQVNGDLNTRCVKAERDVIIPARSSNSDQLFALYSNLTNVLPSKDRKHLAFFAGGLRGFGAIARTRMACRRETGNSDALVLHQAYATGADYLDTLNAAKFCLLPRGIPAW